MEDVVEHIPRFRTIAGRLRQQIRDGVYRTGECIPSEARLTEKFRVSRGTVRDALALLIQENLLDSRRGRGTYVGKASAITALRKRMHKTTIVFSYAEAYSLTHPYLNCLYHNFEESIQKIAKSNNNGTEFSVQCIRQAKTPSGRFTILGAEDSFQAHILNSRYVQGLCMTRALPQEEADELQKRRIPVVELNGIPPYSCAPTVYADRFEGKKLALIHLKELGHRNIGLVMTRNDFEADKETLERIAKFSQESGLNISKQNMIICDDWDRELAYEAAKKTLARPDRPTALVCSDDFLAMGARDAAVELGLSVPQNLSIVGYGNYAPDSGLTTISPPLQKMAQVGAEMLVGIILNKNKELLNICLDDFELIVRQSSGAVPIH